MLVPVWMNHLHWLLAATAFWTLTGAGWVMVCRYRQALTLTHAVTTLCLALICTCFWLVQVRANIDPLILFAIERILWWPLLVAVAAALDLHAAEMLGRDAVLVRVTRRLANRRGAQRGES